MEAGFKVSFLTVAGAFVLINLPFLLNWRLFGTCNVLGESFVDLGIVATLCVVESFVARILRGSHTHASSIPK